MKLIDLLVQELPKRGGWPDGAVEAGFLCSNTTLYFIDANGDCPSEWCIEMDSEVEDNDIEISKDQYESALAASQKPAWNGEGLPPVGCECEYISNGTSWGKVKAIGFDGEKIVIRPSGEIYYAINPSDNDVFMPLRTESEKKRERICDAIYGALTRAERQHNRSDEAEAVYDAIAAGKIPGVKLDD